jgi:rhamnosyltransferase
MAVSEPGASPAGKPGGPQPPPELELSALIRCRDEVRGIGRLIDALREQTIGDRIEIVVIDSGSRDGTLEEVRRRGVEPLCLPPERFTYGRSLNLAATAARARLCVAISAHAHPLDRGWAARMVAAFDEDRVACAFGETVGPDLQRLQAPLLQDLRHAESHPFYGYSNSAGGFRRELWERRPFDELLSASEDREWAWYWLRHGWLVRLDPALAVHHSHADEGPLRTFARARGNLAATRRFRELEPMPLGTILAEWWRGPHLHRSNLRARLDPRRVAQLAGKYAGLRWPRT